MSSRGALPARLLVVVAPVWAAGFVVASVAAFAFATTSHSVAALLGVAVLLGVSMLAERYPVPLDDVDVGGVSLGIVFGVSAVVLFGWAAGVLVCFLAPAVIHLLEHRPPIRVAYNASTYALGAAAAGAVTAPINGARPSELLAKVALAFATQYFVNMILISTVLAVSSRRPFGSLIRTNTQATLVPCAL
ncbi:MAG: hypothetical protein ACRDNX_14350, partial [Gaiellaceae bacterium]